MSWPALATLLLCSCGSNKVSFQRHCLLHPAPPTPQSPSWLQGAGRRPHRFVTSEQEGGGAGRGTEGWSYPDQQELARSDRAPGEAAAECG